MILTDNETKVDLLNNEAIATTIIGLLRERPEHPVTIGVHGDWGAGKSSILEMIEAGLDGNSDVLCIKFNGWRFQGFEDAKIALIEGIVSGLVEKRPALTQATSALKEIYKRIDWLKIAKKAGSLAFTAYTGIPTPELINSIAGRLQSVVSDPSQLAPKENLTSAIDGVNSILKPAESKNVPTEVQAFRKAFDQLLQDAGIDQLVVLIDDLDRCLPEAAIETLEAVRLFVFTSRTAFVVAADEAMIEYAVRKHFPDLSDSSVSRDFARNYLEKLIQIPFRIPTLGEIETRIYVTLLLTGAELGERGDGYSRLIAAARDRLKRPWDSTPLDVTTVNVALGGDANKAHNALMLSDQIGPILANGTKGNPRQIKRFLNTLLLRHRTAEARGFGAEISIPILAKLMLAERFLPSFFEQIATVAAIHPKGYCQDLIELEQLVLQSGSFPANSSPQPKGTEELMSARADETSTDISESAIFAEWKISDLIQTWARVQPPLFGIDLRPYLFITKDRKDFFGPASALGHLAIVAEKLLGPKMSVQALKSELKLLAQPEADKLFEAVRAKIIGGAAFDKMPAGVEGLRVLVEAHPGLQSKLLDFLEALPGNKCGPWVVSGWQGAIKDPDCIVRHERLLVVWSKIIGSPMLNKAAGAAIKTPKGRN